MYHVSLSQGKVFLDKDTGRSKGYGFVTFQGGGLGGDDVVQDTLVERHELPSLRHIGELVLALYLQAVPREPVEGPVHEAVVGSLVLGVEVVTRLAILRWLVVAARYEGLATGGC